MNQNNDENLIWIDMEMTGLDADHDSILEMATLVTNKHLEILAEGPVLAINHALTQLEAMDAWNQHQHGKSGLWQRVLTSMTSHAEAEQATLAFLRQWVPEGKSPMCGNSICQDRRFMHRQMPQLERYFHYRHLDVSTLKELARRWAPSVYSEFSRKSMHTALSDIHDAIHELRHYRLYMGEMGGLN